MNEINALNMSSPSWFCFSVANSIWSTGITCGHCYMQPGSLIPYSKFVSIIWRLNTLNGW